MNRRLSRIVAAACLAVAGTAAPAVAQAPRCTAQSSSACVDDVNPGRPPGSLLPYTDRRDVGALLTTGLLLLVGGAGLLVSGLRPPQADTDD